MLKYLILSLVMGFGLNGSVMAQQQPPTVVPDVNSKTFVATNFSYGATPSAALQSCQQLTPQTLLPSTQSWANYICNLHFPHYVTAYKSVTVSACSTAQKYGKMFQSNQKVKYFCKQ